MLSSSRTIFATIYTGYAPIWIDKSGICLKAVSMSKHNQGALAISQLFWYR
jgi:hypothetical protein